VPQAQAPQPQAPFSARYPVQPPLPPLPTPPPQQPVQPPNRAQKWVAGLVAGVLAAGLAYFLTSKGGSDSGALGKHHGTSTVIVDPPLPPSPDTDPNPPSPPSPDPDPNPPSPPSPDPDPNPPQPADAWPQALAPFTQLIGTGPQSSDAWRGGSCSVDTTANNGDELTVKCTEPDGTTLQLDAYASSATVSQIVQTAASHGATVKPWSHANGPAQGQVLIWSNGPYEYATTFTAYPTIIVEIYGPSLDAVSAAWNAAPLPFQ
jgi:hypothetical protein